MEGKVSHGNKQAWWHGEGRDVWWGRGCARREQASREWRFREKGWFGENKRLLLLCFTEKGTIVSKSMFSLLKWAFTTIELVSRHTCYPLSSTHRGCFNLCWSVKMVFTFALRSNICDIINFYNLWYLPGPLSALYPWILKVPPMLWHAYSSYGCEEEGGITRAPEGHS